MMSKQLQCNGGKIRSYNWFSGPLQGPWPYALPPPPLHRGVVYNQSSAPWGWDLPQAGAECSQPPEVRCRVDSPLIHVCQEMHQAILHHGGAQNAGVKPGLFGSMQLTTLE
jgi:hypothetical protein